MRGVDVRIITPHIPDKKIVFVMTRSYYKRLMDAGATIYEFEPGFVHAKVYLSDDKYAIVGTINLDYRSHGYVNRNDRQTNEEYIVTAIYQGIGESPITDVIGNFYINL